MIDFFELLDEIKKRPLLYLPRHSIFDFQAFYYGYTFFRHKHQIPETEGEKIFSDFLDHIREICPVKTNHSWGNLLLFYSADEKSALDKMFQMFDDFQEAISKAQEEVSEMGQDVKLLENKKEE